MLSVTLSREQVKPLEDFTRAHLGGSVAILLDGEVISKHKVRAVVEGGRLQITRCGDNACDVLLAKLTK
jgi:preprotein translocase subunit SecD